MAATKITITMEPDEYATLKRELAEAREHRQSLIQTTVEPRERHEQAVLLQRLNKLIRGI